MRNQLCESRGLRRQPLGIQGREDGTRKEVAMKMTGTSSFIFFKFHHWLLMNVNKEFSVSFIIQLPKSSTISYTLQRYASI